MISLAGQLADEIVPPPVIWAGRESVIGAFGRHVAAMSVEEASQHLYKAFLSRNVSSFGLVTEESFLEERFLWLNSNFPLFFVEVSETADV